MLIFLHSLRNSLIVNVAIPTSLVATYIGMWAFGFTLNMMPLLAMSLVIGILVDDSIVVLENIHHHLEQGEEQKVAALKGRNEIGFTALSITMVDVAVFPAGDGYRVDRGYHPSVFVSGRYLHFNEFVGIVRSHPHAGVAFL